MEFSPANKIVQLCIQGMAKQEAGEGNDAQALFLKAWEESTTDFEKFLAAYFLARVQDTVHHRLKWFETSLKFARKVNNEATKSALTTLYTNIAACYEQLEDAENAKRNYDLAAEFANGPTDNGPFYHGTRAALQVGDLLMPGGNSNYKEDLVMNHIYFTALKNGAGLAASLAKGEGKERVYIVEPTGPFENDPNVTDKKFPGNLTRSYRSEAPLRIVGEVMDWIRQTPGQVEGWKQQLANNKGEIIN